MLYTQATMIITSFDWLYDDYFLYLWCFTFCRFLVCFLSWHVPFDAQCCHMGTAVKHPVPDRVKPSFVIFDIWALW